MFPELTIADRYRAATSGAEMTVLARDDAHHRYLVQHHAASARTSFVHFNSAALWTRVARHWTNEKMVGFDLETTGVDVEKDRIVTASIVVVGDGPVRSTEWKINPGIEIPEEAAKVHGYTTERIRAEGRADVAAALAEIFELLRGETAAGAPVVAFNQRFDCTLADREARRHDLEPFVPVRGIDPRIIDGFTDRYRKGKRTLEAVCKAYGASLDLAHDAISDALAACRAAWVLGRKGVVIRREDWPAAAAEASACRAEWAACKDDLDLLHAAQERWAREKAIDLAQYFRDKGDAEAAARCLREADGWPVVPFEAERVAA
jgi:DNA polymerase III epsilon subunit-like protein